MRSAKPVPVDRLLVVLDPNVLVSAALSPRGAPAEILRRWLAGEFELVVSPKLLEELRRVFAYPKISKRIALDDSDMLLGLLEDEAQVVSDPDQPAPIEIADPDDVYLLVLAAAAGAALVSGDGHLTALADRFPVFGPADFLARLGEE
jgi:uncharacterized protein